MVPNHQQTYSTVGGVLNLISRSTESTGFNMMRTVDLLHRWCGGILGLVLFVLGLSGTVLLHKEEWIMLPHANDTKVENPIKMASLTAKLLAESPQTTRITFPTDRFGLVQMGDAKGGGAYATQAGNIIDLWDSQWERPELWLVDLHHHLFAGQSGQTVLKIAGLAVMIFSITGTVLWWQSRRTFHLRPFPARMTRSAILRHHRDLGVVATPLLILSALTGTMMISRSMAMLVLSPFSSPTAFEQDLLPPKNVSGKLSATLNWTAVVMKSYQIYPGAQLRELLLPKRNGELIEVRMEQNSEWPPTGNIMLWFDASSGHLVEHHSSFQMSTGTQLFNLAYPIHAAKVGGILYRLVVTLCGVAMTLLGSFAVWSFWFKRIGEWTK